jgi:hypothetical protein
MDRETPKTRKETKKSAKDKKAEVYSAKHARLAEAQSNRSWLTRNVAR